MIKLGDLVAMKSHDTGFVGIVMDAPRGRSKGPAPLVGVHWMGISKSGILSYEPRAWLEVLSEGK